VYLDFVEMTKVKNLLQRQNQCPQAVDYSEICCKYFAAFAADVFLKQISFF